MPSPISFELVTPHGLAFQEDVAEVLLPTPDGQVAILPHHMPLVILVSPGVISFRKHSEVAEAFEHLATAGGLAEISGRRVRLLADSAERADDINEAKVQEALAQAKAMQAKAKDRVSLADATSLIEVSIARLKVAELKRKRVY
jgi:F-type H+-transporting ATPase subunit epsilon